MAERRMFSKSVVRSDSFMDMPVSAQALYLHLGMEADDDGFLGNAKSVMRSVGAALDDMRLLITKGFVLDMGDGVQVITHWRVNNYIQSDRYKPTSYTKEMALLTVAPGKKYEPINGLYPECIQDVSKMDTQIRLGKDRAGKDRVINTEYIKNTESKRADKPPAHPRGEYGWVKLTDDEYSRLIAELGEQEAARVIAYVDESAQTTGNRNKWKDWNLVCRKASREGWGKNNHTAPKRKEREYKNLDKQYQELERGTL